MSGATAPAPRRPNGRALVRRLLKQPNFELRYWNAELLPLGAWPVLEAIADQVARSEHEGEWRPEEIDLASRGIAGLLADKLRRPSATTEVGAHLEALKHARFVTVSAAGGVSLALAPAAAAAPGMDGLRRVGPSPGRPPKWMTDAEREEFKARHREIWQAQCRMDELLARQQGKLGHGLMAVTGGGASGDIRANPPGEGLRDISPTEISGTVGRDIPDDGAGISTEPRAEIAAADDKEIAKSSSAAADISRAHESGPDIRPAYIMADISAEAADIGRRFAAACGKPAHADQVAAAADRLTRQFPDKASLVPRLIERIGATYGGTGRIVSSAAALFERVFTEEPVPAAGGVAAMPAERSQPAAARPPDPRIAAEPAWASAPVSVQAIIVTVLDELERAGPKGHGKSWIKHYADQEPAAFQLAAQKYPALTRIADLGWAHFLEEQTAPPAAAVG